MKITAYNSTLLPQIYITAEMMRLMTQLVKNCEEEVSWLALCKKEDNNYTIYDIEMCEQECGATHTDMMEKGLQEIASNFIKSERIDEMNNVRVWVHSHVNMAVSPSGQDEQTLEEYCENCDDYFIRIIINKKGDWGITFVDIVNGLQFEDMVIYPLYEDEELLIAKQIKALQDKTKELETKLAEIDKEESDIAEVSAKALIKKYVKPKTYVTKYGNYYNKYSTYDYSKYANTNVATSPAVKTPSSAKLGQEIITQAKEDEPVTDEYRKESIYIDYCEADGIYVSSYDENGVLTDYEPMYYYLGYEDVELIGTYSMWIGTKTLKEYGFTECYSQDELEDVYHMCQDAIEYVNKMMDMESKL